MTNDLHDIARSTYNTPNDINTLLNKGADIDAKDKEFGFTALHAAMTGGNDEIALLEKSTESLNIECKNGGVPLQYAIQNSYTMVELLLKYGADKNRERSYGGTPFDFVKQSKDEELMRLFE